MRELYTEGLASHGDPESCVRVREGVGEALTGAGAGWVGSREKKMSRAPTRLASAEGETRSTASARCCAARRGRRTMHALNLTDGNREIHCLLEAYGPHRKGRAVTR